MAHSFFAVLEIINGNPYVLIPAEILDSLFVAAARSKSPIPVRGSINGKPYLQTLMKYRGEWRLYINMKMLTDSPRRIGERIQVEIEYDPEDRTITPHPDFLQALTDHPQAKIIFDQLSPSRQKEIVRYIANLKSPESVTRNIERAINFLLGNGRFVGRDSP